MFLPEIRTKEDIIRLVDELGFLPYFKGEIPVVLCANTPGGVGENILPLKGRFRYIHIFPDFGLEYQVSKVLPEGLLNYPVYLPPVVPGNNDTPEVEVWI